MVGEQGGTYGMASAQSYCSPSAQGPLRTFPSSGTSFLSMTSCGCFEARGRQTWRWRCWQHSWPWAPRSTQTFRRFSWQPTTHPSWRFCRPWWKGRRCTQRTSRRPWVASAGDVDAPATLGLEDGHHHGGETPQYGQDAGVHAAVPLQHALRPVLPLLAEVLLVGLQRC